MMSSFLGWLAKIICFIATKSSWPFFLAFTTVPDALQNNHNMKLCCDFFTLNYSLNWQLNINFVWFRVMISISHAMWSHWWEMNNKKVQKINAECWLNLISNTSWTDEFLCLQKGKRIWIWVKPPDTIYISANKNICKWRF